MSSYLPSVKWPSLSIPVRPWGPSANDDAKEETKATDAVLECLPPHEARKLEEFREAAGIIFDEESPKLSLHDSWHKLNDADERQTTKRDEMLLRVLRYNSLDVEKAGIQIRRTLEWRASMELCAKSTDVMMEPSAGLSVVPICVGKRPGDILMFSPARAYIRRNIDYEKQRIGIAKMFDHIVYDETGPQACRVTVVVDFSDMCVKNVDIFGLRNGINIYLNHFPDLFDRVLLLNYPKFIHGGTLLHFTTPKQQSIAN